MSLKCEPVRVILKPFQVEWAVYAGRQRTIRNLGKVKNTDDYKEKADKLLPDLDANIASCLCELATSVYTKQSWNGAYWSPKDHDDASVMPDVGWNIEVRRTKENNGNGIPIKPSEIKKNMQMVQAFIDEKYDLPMVLSWLAKDDGSGTAYDCVDILLLGTISAVAAEPFCQQTYDAKMVCPAELLVSVETLCPEQLTLV